MDKVTDGVPGLRRSRANLDAVARVTTAEHTCHDIAVLDLSMSGVRLEQVSDLALTQDQVVEVAIVARDRRVDGVAAHVVRVGVTDFALEFGPLGTVAELELGWMIERFGELHDGSVI